MTALQICSMIDEHDPFREQFRGRGARSFLGAVPRTTSTILFGSSSEDDEHDPFWEQFWSGFLEWVFVFGQEEFWSGSFLERGFRSMISAPGVGFGFERVFLISFMSDLCLMFQHLSDGRSSRREVLQDIFKCNLQDGG